MSALQTSRYELKYLITESQADAIRRLVKTRLLSDEHSHGNAIGYRVRSLYLDSRSLTCYNETQCGQKNRFKLRIRFYDDGLDSPVYLEVKRRITNVICKCRATVSRRDAELLLRGASPSASMLVNDTAGERQSLREFCMLRDRLGAVGKVFVDYYRQAYESRGGNQYRVTFDRNVCGSDYTIGSGLKMPPRSRMTKIDGVILEMKFIDRPASWMTDVSQRFGLKSQSVPKYVECVDVLQSTPWSNSGAFASG
ncbi:polyphosphate polymerase domain-containing protein [Mariniblastus sp.]|nr:polyphosphate polymerase domain-containing protein [Mariniblastus sp.]